tara:strand:+ start:2194 stop:2679 length:486 start_codon:yes stop_codon:yes gene_type:complete
MINLTKMAAKMAKNNPSKLGNMIRALIFFFVFLSVPMLAHASGKCKVEDSYPYEAPYDMEGCPEDIQSWMDRLNGCSYFESEMEGMKTSFDDPRLIELKNQWDELQCVSLWCDYDDIFMKYEGDIVYTGIISGYAQMIYGDSELPVCGMEQELSPEEREGG